MQYDRQITISAAGSRFAGRWPAQTMRWSELVQKLAVPVRGKETLAAYLRLPKREQDERKDVGGFVGGTLRDGVRKNSAVLTRDVVTLDLDALPAGGTQDALRRVASLGCASCVYSTRKHEPGRPRLRVLIPLAETVSGEQYEPIARKLAEFIGIEWCDPTTFQAVRMMYWPSVCEDGQYMYTYTDAPLASGEGLLGLYDDWRDVTGWPQVPGQQKAYRPPAGKQEDPTAKQGVVGAFCRTYDIYGAMETWLPGVYAPCAAPGRYSYAAGSTTGGAVIYEDGKYLFSHHGTDPAGGRLCNAFDLVRLHKFGDLDDAAKPGTPVSKLPSFQAMAQAAMGDARVMGLMLGERHAQAVAEFAGSAQGEPGAQDGQDTGWLARLKLTPRGTYDKTIDNAVLILKNDAALRGRIRYEAFANRFSVCGPLPWDGERPYTAWRPDGSRDWTDADDKSLLRYLEKVYGIGVERVALAAADIAARDDGYNAVADYLNGLQWDGVRRLDTLLVDYLGAEDSEYTRAVTRKAFTAAAARVFEPGIKFDTVLTLTGGQGIGKSTLFRLMGRSWFCDSLASFDGKEAMELIQGSWIVELSELESLNKSETSTAKQYLSKTEDIFREPYGRRTNKYPRRCVFFGTTNEREFLRDATGNRRFWPVAVGVNGHPYSVFNDLPGAVDQLWAEAAANYRLGEPLFLDDALAQQALERQKAFSVEDSMEGLVRNFLDKPVPADWDTRTAEQRRLFWGGGFAGAENGALEARRKACAAEVLAECLGYRMGQWKQSDTRRVNAVLDNIAREKGWERARDRFGIYGQQRGFRAKTGAEGCDEFQKKDVTGSEKRVVTD